MTLFVVLSWLPKELDVFRVLFRTSAISEDIVFVLISVSVVRHFLFGVGVIWIPQVLMVLLFHLIHHLCFRVFWQRVLLNRNALQSLVLERIKGGYRLLLVPQRRMPPWRSFVIVQVLRQSVRILPGVGLGCYFTFVYQQWFDIVNRFLKDRVFQIYHNCH